jgi:AcrR family transcriptional regulator
LTQRQKGDDRKKQILDVAVRAFSQKEYDAVTTKDIALTCGINESLIYLHFHTKEELYFEVTKYFYSTLQERWFKNVASAGSSRIEALRNFYIERFTEIYDKPDRAHAFFNFTLASQRSIELKDLTCGASEELFNGTQEIVDGCLREGSLRDDYDSSQINHWFLGYFFFVLFIVRDSAKERYPLDKAIQYLDQLIFVLKPEAGKLSRPFNKGGAGTPGKKK